MNTSFTASDDISIVDTVPVEQSVQDVLNEANLNCSTEKMKILLECMNRMGAACLSDMKFLTEEDLNDILPTLQCRKLISFIKNKENEKPSDPGSGLLQNGLSPRDRSNVFNYELLEETIPSVILSCFERKIRLSPADRRLLIRLVATDLLSKFSSPGRKLARHVAIKIVLKYPKSLADTGINGKLLGDGCGSFILQLENCLANMKRANDQNDEETSSGSETLSKKKRNRLSTMHLEKDLLDSTVKLLPDELESCRTSLITKFQTMNRDEDLDEETKVLLNKSFAGIRSIIMSQRSTINELQEQWPIVFTIVGFGQHYQQVVAKDFNMFKENLSKYMIQFLSFMQSLQLKKKELKPVVKRINEAKGKSKDDGPEVVGMIELLSVYFNEKFENIIFKETTWVSYCMLKVTFATFCLQFCFVMTKWRIIFHIQLFVYLYW